MIRSELRLPLRSMLVWSVSIAALVFLVVGVYPSIRDNHSFDSVHGNLSRTVQALLGGSSLTSATGYLSTQLFAFFLPAVLIGIAALTVASWIPLVAMDSAVRFNVALSHLSGICLQMGLFCCALALSAQAVATTFGRRVAGIASAVAYTVVRYLLYGLSATVHPLSYLRPLLLWRWYLSNDPLHSGTAIAEVAVLLAVCVAEEIAGILAFDHRDLRN